MVGYYKARRLSSGKCGWSFPIFRQGAETLRIRGRIQSTHSLSNVQSLPNCESMEDLACFTQRRKVGKGRKAQKNSSFARTSKWRPPRGVKAVVIPRAAECFDSHPGGE